MQLFIKQTGCICEIIRCNQSLYFIYTDSRHRQCQD